MSKHETHPEIVVRLRRAKGHLEKVIEMIEAEQACPAVAQQLEAVEKAISSAKKTFIHDHIEHCLDEHSLKDTEKRRQTIKEFKKITKYL